MVIIIVMTTSCAKIEISATKDFSDDKRQGIKYYNAKPYLMVEYNPAKDVAMKSSIIYLPDLENPQYVRVRPGFGSADLQLTLENGILVSYGGVIDSKIPETISAGSELITAATGVFKQGADLEAMNTAKDLISKTLSSLKENKETAVKSNLLTENQIQMILKIENGLTEQIRKLNEANTNDVPAIVKALDEILKGMEEIKVGGDTDVTKLYNGKIDTLKSEVKKARETLQKPEENPKSGVKLFAIEMKNGKVILTPNE